MKISNTNFGAVLNYFNLSLSAELCMRVSKLIPCGINVCKGGFHKLCQNMSEDEGVSKKLTLLPKAL